MNYRTRQKAVIVSVLKASGQPLTVEQIAGKAHREMPEIGISTIYRVLKQEIEEGKIHKVELPDAGVYYELAGERHHHYFFCDQCRNVLSVEGCVQGIQKLLPPGSRMLRHEFVIYGKCGECAEA